MAVPKYNEFFPDFMEFLSDEQEHVVQEVRDYLAGIFNLSDEDMRATTPSGGNLFFNRVSWTQTYLKKAGLIANPEHAVVVITPLGKKVLDDETEFTLDFVKDLMIKNGEYPTESATRFSHVRRTKTRT